MPESLKELFSKTKRRLPDELPPMLKLQLYPFRNHLNEVISQIRERTPETIRNIYVDLLDDFSFNAQAFIADKHEFVGINAGCLLVVPRFFNFLLSQPQAFPDIGNSANEKPTFSSFVEDLLSISGCAHDFELSALQFNKGVTQDRVRRQYALFLASLASDFLLHHELAHIIRCHLPYLTQALSSEGTTERFALEEFELVEQPREKAIRRVLEIDADAAAARVQLGGYLQNPPSLIAEVALYKDAVTADWGWPDACRAWCRAIALLYGLMAIPEGTQSVFSKDTHPHPIVRFNSIANEAWPKWRDRILNQSTKRRIAEP
jgi:hypothetical protein